MGVRNDSTGCIPSRWLILGTSRYAVQGMIVAYLFNFNKSETSHARPRTNDNPDPGAYTE